MFVQNVIVEFFVILYKCICAIGCKPSIKSTRCNHLLIGCAYQKQCLGLTGTHLEEEL